MYYIGSTLSFATLVARRLLRPQCRWIRLKSSAATATTKATVAELKQPTMSFHDMPGPTMMESLQRYKNEGVGNHHLIQVDLFEKYGPTFKFKMPGKIMVCTCCPADIEKVFRGEGYPANRSDDFISGTMSYFHKKGLDEGLIGNDESWQVHRSAVGSKLLRPVALKPFVPDLCAVSDDTIASFKEGRNYDVLPQLLKWSTESIGTLTFGRRIGLNTATPTKMALDFIQAVLNVLAIEAKLQYYSFPFHKYFETPTLKRLYGSLDVMWNTSNYYLQKEREDRTASRSVVRQLIDDGKLSQDQINQMTAVLFAGGVDSTSNATLILLCHLSEFPKAQQKLYEEIDQTLPNSEIPTHNHVSNMPYLRAVLRESARLLPASPNIVRQLKESIILSGYEVPPHTNIIISSMPSPTMNKNNFGDDFEKFNPDRWLRGAKKPPPFAWVRFGFGPRMCVGKRVAELEMALFLIRLLQKYEIEVRRPEDEKMEWDFKLILNAAKPFNMDLKKRK